MVAHKFTHNFVPTTNLVVVTDPETGKRTYRTPSGKVLESVTTFIGRNWDKSHLVAWKKRLGEDKANRESKRASDRGNVIHKAVEKHLRNERYDFGSDILNENLFYMIKPIVDRLDNIRLIEQPLYSEVLKLAGTPDVIGDYKDTLAVVDFKGSTRVKKKSWIVNYFLQTACYGVMYEEHYGVMPEKAVIIMATEQAAYPQLFIEPMDRCVKMLTNFIRDPVKFQEVIASNK